MIAAMRGVSRSLTNEVTTVPNAAPMTIPTAISTTLPRNKNCLNPCIPSPFLSALDWLVWPGILYHAVRNLDDRKASWRYHFRPGFRPGNELPRAGSALLQPEKAARLHVCVASPPRSAGGLRTRHFLPPGLS